MQLSVRVLCLVTTLVTSITLPAHGREPPAQPGKAAWPRCGRVTEFPGPAWSPQQPPAGWEIEKLSRAKNLFDSLDSSAVMVIHGGRPVAAWGDVDVKYTAQSVRKALISSLVGIAVAENRLELDDTLEELGIDDTGPGLTPAERRATLRDLLMSRSGVFHSALYEVGNWKRVRAELAKTKSADPERFRPGAYWVYNNWDFNAVGTIVEQAFGQPMGLTFENRIAEPIGMQDFTPADVEYTDKNDSTEKHFGNWSEHRAYVFNLSTRDLARYGLLYLNCGRWQDRQVIPRKWVLESTTGRDTRDGRRPDERETEFGDYGYLWQVDRPGSRRLANLKTREPIYIASGFRGHFMIVAPYLDLVIAHQVATVGGVGEAAQLKRAREGTPEVSERDLERLFAAIIAAHPEAERALE